MSEPRFDSLYSAWATIAGGTGYDSTYSAMKAALEKVTGQENYDSVYSIAADLADDVETGSASVAKNTQLNEEITENGTYTFTPDEGYVYDSVTVSVDAGSKAEGTIKIVNNGTYDVTSYAQANVAVGGESYSYKVNQVDEAGLRAIGWDDESIGYFRDNFGGIYPWEVDNYKVSDANKALYGVVGVSTDMDKVGEMIYCPMFDASGVWDLSNLFQGCKKLKSIPTLDTSSTGYLRYFFEGCESLITIPQLNIGKARSLSNMFSSCKGLTSIPLLDTSAVTEMNYMFYGCTSLTSIPLLDTSAVTKMERMFYGCSQFTNIPPLDTGSVTDMSSMFAACTNLTSIPLLDTGSVTNMNNLFSSCKSLTSIPSLDTGSVTIMYGMFRDCTSLTSIPPLNVSSVTNVGNMFSSCTSLTSIPDMNFVKLATFGGSQYESWVYSCQNLQSIGVIDCDKITNIGYVLGGSNNNNLTHLGGFRNLGKASSVSGTNSNYFLYYAPNLTYESVMNVLNLLYDRASAGLSVLTLKLHPNHLAMLSEDDIAVATNKGWTLV